MANPLLRNRPRFPWLHLTFLAALILSLSPARAKMEPAKEDFLNNMILKSLGTFHYHPVRVDDEFSGKAFKLYLKRMDAQKRFLTQADVDSLKRFESRIDDELKKGNYGLVDF